jgi:hypothetical protein
VSIDKCLSNHKPYIVIIQRNTTITFCAALAALYNRISVVHIEAGLQYTQILWYKHFGRRIFFLGTVSVSALDNFRSVEYHVLRNRMRFDHASAVWLDE